MKNNIKFKSSKLENDQLVVQFENIIHNKDSPPVENITNCSYTKNPFNNCQIQTLGGFSNLLGFFEYKNDGGQFSLMDDVTEARDLMADILNPLYKNKNGLLIDVYSHYQDTMYKIFSNCIIFETSYENINTESEMTMYYINLNDL